MQRFVLSATLDNMNPHSVSLCIVFLWSCHPSWLSFVPFSFASVYFVVPLWHPCTLRFALQGLWSVLFKSSLPLLSVGMLHTAEDPDTLEKVHQGEEMPLCGVGNICVCVSTHNHTDICTHSRTLLTLHLTFWYSFTAAPCRTFSLCSWLSV